jgi:NAD(P)-dependent dehydrogenase (short-subunit alcohol dehydrogenase family)
VRTFVAQRSGGAIVNVSSVHGRAAYSGAVAYDISKAGVDALTRYIAVEYGPVGIRANAIAPGGVRTPLFERVVAAADDPERAEADAIRDHPLRRVAEPREIASVAAFLLSDEASFVSGQSLAVDGALTARCCTFPLDPALADAYGLAPGPAA